MRRLSVKSENRSARLSLRSLRSGLDRPLSVVIPVSVAGARQPAYLRRARPTSPGAKADANLPEYDTVSDRSDVPGLKGWRVLATTGAVSAYLLVVLGGIVRITGSGMGCGDDWPLCNGKLIPPMDLPTFIEYGHRLVAAGVSFLVVALAVWAWKRRDAVEWAPMRRVSAWTLVLLVVQVMLGAITVWLELPPSTVVLHLGTAMAFLAMLVIACCQGFAYPRMARVSRDKAWRVGLASAAAGLAVVLAGALVANLGAAPACQGFPLCNGAWFPAGESHWRIHLHWGHRMLAYGLVLWTFALPVLARRWRKGDRVAGSSAWAVVIAGLAQVAVAAAMILTLLADSWRALHVAVGAALFAALVWHTWVLLHPVTGEPDGW
jgi:heme A synthase